MKRLIGFILPLMFLIFSNLQAQFVAEGWRVAAEIKANAKLHGSWDVIAGYDLDDDGNREFFITNDPTVSGFTEEDTDPWTVFYFESTGDDTYELRWSWAPPIDNRGGRSYPAIGIADVDQDQLFELWFGTPSEVTDDPPNPNRLYAFEFDGAAFPTDPSESWTIGVPDNFLFLTSGLAFGDVDNDGAVEIVIQSRRDDYTGSEQGRTMLVANSGGIDIGLGFGAFTAEFLESDIFKGGAVYDPRVVDFDGDGIQEIWILTWDFISIAIYEGTGADTYELQVDIDEIFDPLDYGHRRGARFYDVDGDGKLEMYSSALSGDGSPGAVILYIGSTDDVSTLTAADVKILGGKVPDPGQAGSAIGDIDGDGMMDFLYTTTNPESGNRSMIYRMEYKGAGDLADSTSYDWSLFFEDTQGASDLRNLAIDDLDGDGKMDVLVTNLDVETTDDASVYIIESETQVSVQSTPNIVHDFRLRQNYPNPFNPSTTIEFDILATEHVVLSVYDLDGRKVTTLIDEKLSPGTHEAIFNGRKLASGIYFYELLAGKTKIVKKMALAK